MKSIVLGITAFILAIPSSRATVLAESTFDSSDQGWQVGDLFDNSGNAAPIFSATGGNPGGHISTPDLFNWNAFQAPSSFLGNQSAAYGGTLHIDEKVVASDGLVYPMVVISDGATVLQFSTTPPGTDWTSFDIPLSAGAGWEVAGGGVATESQLQAVLGSLTSLKIDADWLSGDDNVALDNVRLTSSQNSVPETGSTLAMLCLGIALLGFAARKNRPNEAQYSWVAVRD